jgi:agmatinase
MDLKEDTLHADEPLFGNPLSFEDSQLVIIPAPWEPTTSYKGGTSNAPGLIRQASHQMDYFHEVYKLAYPKGIYYKELNPEIEPLHTEALKICENIQAQLTSPKGVPASFKEDLKTANALSEKFNSIIYSESQQILKAKKTPALFGGDHSCPYGLMQALSEHYEDWSILHIDAHFDLRIAYQGFEHSHASIIYNATQLKNPPAKIAHIGIRDFSESEYNYALEHKHYSWTDKVLKRKEFDGEAWSKTCEEILKPLSKNLYISFDIDGMDPQYCPQTGTPVPGGLTYNQATQLIEKASKSFNIIGFDLVEVATQPGDYESWDINVGTRMLFELCLSTLSSGNKK